MSQMDWQVLDIAGKARRPGVPRDEIDRIVHEASLEGDRYPQSRSACTSVNVIICPGIHK